MRRRVSVTEKWEWLNMLINLEQNYKIKHTVPPSLYIQRTNIYLNLFLTSVTFLSALKSKENNTIYLY